MITPPENGSPTGVDPSLLGKNPQEFDAMAEFEKHRQDLNPEPAEALQQLGPEAVKAYASVSLLYHNTLDTFVPTIMEEGLRATSEVATPEAVDIAFAEELFKRKGMYEPSTARRFNIYIKGERGDREPGVFFYGKAADNTNTSEYNEGYGQPERLVIFAQEMAALAHNETYTPEERAKAMELFEKYAAIANGGGHVAVLRANPFNPAIFNQRLAELPRAGTSNPEAIIEALKVLDLSTFEGIYIHGVIPPEDLQLMDVQLPVPTTVQDTVDPSRSRFFYVPPHLKRA